MPNGSYFDRNLLSGDRSLFGDAKRLVRIGGELVRGFHTFRGLPTTVTVFGSARFRPGDRYYELSLEAGRELGNAGFAVMTGAGPGVMEAANRGARESGAISAGCGIRLAHEQGRNPYIDQYVEFHHFFVRKVMLTRYSSAFVLMPGGFGTLDEIFETATLIQTGKIRNFPIVAMGSEYWSKLWLFLRETLVAHGTIDAADLDLVFSTDDPAEAAAHIRNRLATPSTAPELRLHNDAAGT